MYEKHGGSLGYAWVTRGACSLQGDTLHQNGLYGLLSGSPGDFLEFL